MVEVADLVGGVVIVSDGGGSGNRISVNRNVNNDAGETSYWYYKYCCRLQESGDYY